MKINKKLFTVFLCTMFCVSLFAQEQSVVRKSSTTTENKKAETSVEQEYLSDVDGVVILSLAASDEYDNKLVAMQFLESAVENGNTSEDIMSMMQTVVREQGKTLVMVTHDNHLAGYADRIFHIIDGKIVKIEDNRKGENEE